MNTESWCTVECRSSENWTRSNRKHFGKAFDSKVFKDGPDESEGRLQFPKKKEVHRERRHFPEKCKKIFHFTFKVFHPIFIRMLFMLIPIFFLDICNLR